MTQLIHMQASAVPYLMLLSADDSYARILRLFPPADCHHPLIRGNKWCDDEDSLILTLHSQRNPNLSEFSHHHLTLTYLLHI